MKTRRRSHEHQGPAVFSRNHSKYLVAAAARSARAPGTRVTFRAEKKWVSVSQTLKRIGSIPIYFAVVGGRPRVEYVATLCDIRLDPRNGDSKTRELLRHSLPASAKGGAVGDYSHQGARPDAIRDHRLQASQPAVSDCPAGKDQRRGAAQQRLQVQLLRGSSRGRSFIRCLSPADRQSRCSPRPLTAFVDMTSTVKGCRPNSVRVVNLAQGESEERTRAAYRDVFPYIGDEHFDFSGALEWVRALRDANGKP